MADLRKLKEEVAILDMARSMDLHPYPVGRYYSLREHDSVRIDPVKNVFYRNSTGEHGSVIDFVMVFGRKSFQAAIGEIRHRTGGQKSEHRIAPILKETDERRKFVLPNKSDTYRNVFAYLIRTRGIDQIIVQEMVRKHQLFQDTKRNCVFVSYDDKGRPVFACKRGTSTAYRFVADVPGSDYTHGCFFPGEGHVLLVCESVIDLMSYMTLKPESRKYDRLALAGTGKKTSLYWHIERGQYEALILALDNDDAGRRAADAIIAEALEEKLIGERKIITDLPEMKDWNEDLIRRRERNEI